MTMTVDQARRFIMCLSDALEVLEELDDEPTVTVNCLHGLLDDLAVKIAEAE